MPHDLLAAPFLGQHLLLRPGSTAGVQLPRGHFGQLAQAAAAGGSYPPWLPGLARQRWGGWQSGVAARLRGFWGRRPHGTGGSVCLTGQARDVRGCSGIHNVPPMGYRESRLARLHKNDEWRGAGVRKRKNDA